jgi:hypothetical protein
MTGMTPEQVARRRAVEALRSGVPSWDAVSALGSGQGEAEDRFTDLLDGAQSDHAGGLLLGAGFGAGKSHALTHLSAVALQRGFAVSTVVVSKETPLYDPAKVLRAAVDTLTGPGRTGGLLADAVACLDPDSTAYADLRRWVGSAPSGLDERFAATLLLHERLQGHDAPEADDVLDAAVRFWAGEPLRVPDLRRALKGVGAGGQFSFAAVPVRELARQRTRFLPRLLRAAGYCGWVVLFDEVELIGRYSLLQRGRSYAELARWVGAAQEDPTAPLVTVLALTDDFEAAVLVGKDDRHQVPSRMRDKQTPEWAETAALAEKGIRALQRDVLLLAVPDAAELDRTYRTVKQLHASAYDWSPPDVPGLERLGATRMRQYVRAWINAWDLVRLDPAHVPDPEVLHVTSRYDEDQALEQE